MLLGNTVIAFLAIVSLFLNACTKISPANAPAYPLLILTSVAAKPPQIG
jgi:hypothetical protein